MILIATIAALLSGALAFFIGVRERLLVHRVLAAGLALLAVETFLNALSLGAASGGEMVFWQNCSAAAAGFLPGIWLAFSLVYGRGNYRDFLKKWRPLLIFFLAAPLCLEIMAGGQFIVSATRQETGQWAFHTGLAGWLMNFVFLAGMILVLMNLERTFRASVGTMRWRIKFMILGPVVLFAARGYTSSQVFLFHGVNFSWETINAGALLIACLLMLHSLFRAGHFTTEIYPSQTVLHGSLTALLAGVYLVVIGVFARIASFGGGDTGFALKAFLILVALVLLAVFLLSDRARLRTSRFISRHFQRPVFDYRTVWRNFTESTAGCMTRPELCQAAIKLTSDIFQALSVTIWLVDEKENLVYAASTFLSETRAESLAPANAEAAAIIRALQKNPGPVDIDSSREPWAAALRACHSGEFRNGGHRICVPMTVGGEVAGLMLLGDRVGGADFSPQDFDLLKCLGGEMAARLLNLRLSQKLLSARELEAFQTMSAFFVHDLKNAASTLSLMLQNLPIHFDDPAFRQDAVRMTAKSVSHINHLIERLGRLRHESKIKPAEADLNSMIAGICTQWEKISPVPLTRNCQPLPKFAFDSEQMLKVVDNLVLNARDAVGSEGRIQIATARLDGHAVLSVSDNGCGMPPEFLSRSLFRPFQTTKKNGIGIGMFQSKMIVEAHRGRMEVESALGKGTTFRIFLPLKNETPE